MNKFLTKIIGASLAIAMMIGVGVGVNANKVATEANAATVAGTFQKTNIENLTAGDVILIVNSANKAMSNNNGTSSAPSATEVTITNNTISNPLDTLVWTFGKNGDNYKFLAGTSGSNYLYCTNTNNGVRVGTNENNEFVIDNGYLKNVATSRYVGVYNNNDWRCYTSINNNISGQTFSYFKRTQSSFGTLHHIKVNTPATKTTFEVGEVFDRTGLTLIGYDAADENNANTQDITSGFTTNYDGHTFLVGEIGQQTVTVTHTSSGKTVPYNINVEAAADYVLDGDSNAISGLGTNTSTEETGSGQLGGIEYGYYALAINEYNNARNLEFNKTIQDAYVGNNESYGKYINKIKITLQYENNFQKLSLFKGDSAIPGTTAVAATGSGTSRTYDFENDSEYFALKQTTTGSWIVITKIEIYLGSEVPVVDTVSASIKAGTYYAGTTLTASNFDVTVNWTAGKQATHPTEGFTWKVNGINNGTLNEGNNSVIVTYEGHDSEAFNVVGTPATAQMIIENTLNTQTTLAYHYEKDDHIVSDELTVGTTGATDTNYVNWEETGTSGATYKGRSAGGNDSLQLNSNNNDKGIVTTTSGGKVSKVTVSWNGSTSANRTIDIYGKHTAYQAVSDLYNTEKQGTLIGSIVKGTSTEAVIDGEYEFIAIRSRSSAMYIDSISIEWAGETTYDISNISIRFGGLITKALWNELDTNEHLISGFGVMIASGEALNEDEFIKDNLTARVLADAEPAPSIDNADIVDYYMSKTEMATPVGQGNNYVWNLFQHVDEADVEKVFVAVAYIKVGDEYVFMKQVRYSAKTLAGDYIANRGCDSETAGGSLAVLAA